MQINYLTTNTLKYALAKRFFEASDAHELIQHSFHVPEIQDISCEEIARQSAVFAARELNAPCVTMDAGFFIEALGGFPGPFVKYTNEWIPEEKLLSMLDEDDSRVAYFQDSLAIGFPDGTSQVFTHKTTGRLADEGEYTKTKWPANSLFIPDGYTTPLGSLPEEEQADFWQHENTTWAELVDYLDHPQTSTH